MTIKIYSDRIDIGDFTLFEGNGGVQFGGVARAEQFKSKTPFQGYQKGYFVAGYPGAPPYSDLIYKFPFVSEVVAATGAEITEYTASFASSSSSTHGYSAGGDLNHPSYSPPSTLVSNTIDKFPFAIDANATDVGDLPVVTSGCGGTQSTEQGFVSGGFNPPGGTITNTISKFPFATDTNTTDHGDLVQGTARSAMSASPTHGYMAGGDPGVNTIQKFPFASTSGQKDVGDLTVEKYIRAGVSSDTHGYAAGGIFPSVNVLEKFPFATDSNSTDVGDITDAVSSSAGVSSTTFGYFGGGSPTTTRFQKFPFATDTNTTVLTALPAGGAPFGSNQV
jgi:hypothetical protein